MEHADVAGLYDNMTDAIKAGEALLKAEFKGIGHLGGDVDSACLRLQDVPSNCCIGHKEFYGLTVWDSLNGVLPRENDVYVSL